MTEKMQASGRQSAKRGLCAVLSYIKFVSFSNPDKITQFAQPNLEVIYIA